MVSSLVMPEVTAVTVDSASERFLRFARTRDVSLFDALASEHLDSAYSHARRLLRSDSEAQDAVQEALILLLRTADRYDGTVPFGAWLARRVYFCALRIIRSRGRRVRYESAAAKQASAIVGAATEFDDDLVRMAVSSLPERYRAAIDLHYFAGLSQGDTARALGVKEDAVAKRLQRARDFLRALLSKRGFAVTGTAIALALESAPAHAAPPTLTAAAAAVTASTGAAASASLTIPVVSGFFSAKIAAIAALLVGAGLSTLWWPESRAKTARQSWDFSSGAQANEFTGEEGSWRWVADGDGAMQVDEYCVVDLPMPESATKAWSVSLRTRPEVKTGDRNAVYARWSATDRLVQITDLSAPIVADGATWHERRIYVTERTMDVSGANGRSRFEIMKPSPGAKLCLVMQGRQCIDDLRIEPIDLRKVPDTRPFFAAIARIPVLSRSGIKIIDHLPTAIPGQSIQVTFSLTERPWSDRDWEEFLSDPPGERATSGEDADEKR